MKGPSDEPDLYKLEFEPKQQKWMRRVFGKGEARLKGHDVYTTDEAEAARYHEAWTNLIDKLRERDQRRRPDPPNLDSVVMIEVSTRVCRT